MKNCFLSSLILLLLSANAIAQTAFEKCGTDRLLRHAHTQPDVVARMAAAEHHTQQWANQHQNELRDPQEVLTIPVVVHVVSYVGNPASNISDAQIFSQIEELNRIYRRQNTNASQTRAIFLGVAADAEIEFCMAQRDPNGFPTNGITRTVSDTLNWESDGMKNDATGGHDAWDTGDYLNIWVCNRLRGGDVLGYAFIPGQAPSPQVDGLAIAHNCFGTTGTAAPPYHQGRTAAHEIGHWLSLYHPWATGNDAGNCTDDDFVTDTPQTDEPNFACSFNSNSCNAESPDLPDMVENYMDYATDACQNIFTLGQKARMRSVLSFGGFHYSVAQNSLACQPVEQGANDVNLLQVLEPNGPGNCTTIEPTVQFQNFGTNALVYLLISYSVDGGAPQLYDWTGLLEPLDTLILTLPAINTISNSIVHTLNIDLTQPNASADFNPANNAIEVTFASITVGGAVPIQQDFAAAALPTGWTVANADNATTFALTNTPSPNGQAIYMHNFAYNANNTTDELKLHRLNLSTLESAQLSFDVAYALKDSGNQSDILEVLVSSNCEATYDVVASYTAADLITAAPTAAEFAPASANEWQTKTVDLSSYVGAKNVYIKLRQTRKQGNNLYLDNINMGGSAVGIAAPNAPQGATMSLYPNPSSQQLNILLKNTANTEIAALRIYSATGQMVWQQSIQLNASHQQIVTPNVEQLPNGMYIVQLQSATQAISQKWVLAR